MRGTIEFVDCTASRGAVLGFICMAALAVTALPCRADNLLDVSTVTRLDGAKVDPDRSSSTQLTYSVPGSVANTVAATGKLLAADGWKQYVSPSEDPDDTGLDLKKGPQGPLVSFTMTAGAADQSSVYYVPNRLNAQVPAEVSTVLAFYRRELASRNFQEQSTGAVLNPDRALLTFSSPDGTIVLNLTHKYDLTAVSLVLKVSEAVLAARAKAEKDLLFGNALPAEAAVTINSRTVNVSGGVGTKGPDGPSLDLAPGKYPYSIKMQSQTAQHDDVQIGAAETWGLLIGPGGAMPMQMY